MDTHHDIAVESVGSPSYITPSALEPGRQASTSSRRWGFGRSQNRNSTYSNRSDRDNRVSIRNSVAYPSDSTFEASIVKGVAQTGQRYQAKTHLVDLDRSRRKSWSPEHQSSQYNHMLAETASLSLSKYYSASEDEVEDEVTDQQAVAEMYHNAISPMARTPVPTPSRNPSPALPVEPDTPVRKRVCTIRNFFRRLPKPPRARSRLEERAGSLEAGLASVILQPPTEQPARDPQ
ncbi:hypothetical protein F4821DRAFT_219578 [Hypoxylon rubiginosum]|uniref:Uncharacterized protein n=1 Tax=Hypoxylon rubiginosum TaxID=110542 RepID=A0ACC0CPA0_9PEZI|nr:hypothetical protein F4821DRAFT_219578 [Hypoxylon rubiginosum]